MAEMTLEERADYIASCRDVRPGGVKWTARRARAMEMLTAVVSTETAKQYGAMMHLQIALRSKDYEAALAIVNSALAQKQADG